MNVVAQAIEFLGGSLQIESEPARGTTFRFNLPLSLAIIYTLTFRLGQFTLSIPTNWVTKIGRKHGDKPPGAADTYDLRRLLGASSPMTSGEHILKIRHPRFGGTRPGGTSNVHIAVDQIVGNQPIMMMPVGELVAHMGYFAGVGIREDGSVTVLLDLETLPLEPPYWVPAAAAISPRGRA
jgi:two-component system chemotaxis sensor kinase CheA